MSIEPIGPITEEQRILLSDYATRSFRNQADGDYIAARGCYRAELYPQFLWLSLQAVEKYLKAILLFNCRPTKEYGHDAAGALRDAKSLPKICLRIPGRTERFVQFVTKCGKNRYLDDTSSIDGEALYELDETVWHIRRFCQDFLLMPGDSERYEAIDSEIRLRHAHQAEDDLPAAFRLDDGLLEKILADGPSQTRAILVYKNLCFGRSRRRKITGYGMITHFENPTHVMHPELLPLLEQLVYIPARVLADLKKRSVR